MSAFAAKTSSISWSDKANLTKMPFVAGYWKTAEDLARNALAEL